MAVHFMGLRFIHFEWRTMSLADYMEKWRPWLIEAAPTKPPIERNDADLTSLRKVL